MSDMSSHFNEEFDAAMRSVYPYLAIIAAISAVVGSVAGFAVVHLLFG